MFATARSSLADVFNEQPLMLGALGIAIGAGIAASLPSTEIEAAYFGESSDEFKAKASGFAQEQTARAEAVARDAVFAASEEARRQGLTTDNLKAAVGDVAEKLKRVAEAADEKIRTE
jgi:hypothetical protein